LAASSWWEDWRRRAAALAQATSVIAKPHTREVARLDS
jgi:hypothetical protein